METNQRQAQYIKKYRLIKRIETMLNKYNNCLFLTFTFNNETLKNTSQETRQRYIKRYLNDFAQEYILNIDFGKANNREHYHAIATPKYKLFLYDFYNKKYGYVKGEPIGKLKRFANANKSIKELAERLSEHATKETTQGYKLIYSRPNKTIKESKYTNEINNKLFWLEEERELAKRQKETEKEIQQYFNTYSA